MNVNEKNDERMNAIFKDAHSKIQPADSWQGLRKRIDDRISGNNMPLSSASQLYKNVAFWRRTALALAACLIITSALLLYIIGYPADNNQSEMVETNQYLLSKTQLSGLSTAFSHVRQLFGQCLPWMIVDSTGRGEIGVDNKTEQTAEAGKIIVIRLLVKTENADVKPLYFDIVTFADQQVRFSTSLADDSTMDVSLKPMLTSVGRIKVEINANINGGSRAGGTTAIADNVFTSLIRLRADNSWVNINAAGHAVSNI